MRIMVKIITMVTTTISMRWFRYLDVGITDNRTYQHDMRHVPNGQIQIRTLATDPTRSCSN